MIQRIRQSAYRLYAVLAIAAAMAMMPAAAATAPDNMMSIEFCTDGGQTRTISIPIEPADGQQDEHCAKPCHACVSRKKAAA